MDHCVARNTIECYRFTVHIHKETWISSLQDEHCANIWNVSLNHTLIAFAYTHSVDSSYVINQK